MNWKLCQRGNKKLLGKQWKQNQREISIDYKNQNNNWNKDYIKLEIWKDNWQTSRRNITYSHKRNRKLLEKSSRKQWKYPQKKID